MAAKQPIADMDTILYFQPPQQPYVPAKLAGVREIASRRGTHVQVVLQNLTSKLISELSEFWNAIGAIVECATRTTPLDTTMFGALPVVLFSPPPGQRVAPALSVSHDSAATARVAARELLSTGFSNFAFVPAPEPNYWSRTRERVFSETIRKHGGTCAIFRADSPPEILDGEPSSIEWQTELRRFLRELPKPCGVFAANDVVGETVLKAARFEGISVPDEMAVLGVDNDERVCNRCEPLLTSIDPDFRRAGMLAAELLLEAAAKGGTPPAAGRLHFGPLRVVYRESMRTGGISDKRAAEALALIRRDACAGLRAERVAAVFPCSRRLAFARFRKATGHTILEEIHAVQLETAKRLLETTDIPLKALSDFCGFEDPNSLRKFFRRETGETLRAWRQASRKSGALRGRR